MNALLYPPEPTRHGFTGQEMLQMLQAGVLYEDGRFELIDGEIIDMPAEGGAHVSLKIALNRFLIEALPHSISVAPECTLRLSDRSWPTPDFFVFPASIDSDAVRGRDTLLIVELSDSSLSHDLNRKADLYRAEGVREYWVIDLNARQVHVHRADGDWPAFALPFTSTLEPALIPGLKVRLADLLPE